MKLKILIAILSGVLLASLSINIQTTYRGVVGNLCGLKSNELCYEDLPRGGWPLPWIKDSGGTSIIGTLGVEDDMEPVAFLIDSAFYGILVFLGWSGISKLREKK